MPEFEYKVVPAPTRGEKAKGVKTAEGRFANVLETLMNTLASDGWEYQRADMLPSEERQGLTGSTTNWRNVLVFRREKTAALAEFQPRDVAANPVMENQAEDTARKDPPPLNTAPASLNGSEKSGATPTGITAALKARAAASFKAKDAEDSENV